MSAGCRQSDRDSLAHWRDPCEGASVPAVQSLGVTHCQSAPKWSDGNVYSTHTFLWTTNTHGLHSANPPTEAAKTVVELKLSISKHTCKELEFFSLCQRTQCSLQLLGGCTLTSWGWNSPWKGTVKQHGSSCNEKIVDCSFWRWSSTRTGSQRGCETFILLKQALALFFVCVEQEQTIYRYLQWSLRFHDCSLGPIWNIFQEKNRDFCMYKALSKLLVTSAAL